MFYLFEMIFFCYIYKIFLKFSLTDHLLLELIHEAEGLRASPASRYIREELESD